MTAQQRALITAAKEPPSPPPEIEIDALYPRPVDAVARKGQLVRTPGTGQDLPCPALRRLVANRRERRIAR